MFPVRSCFWRAYFIKEIKFGVKFEGGSRGMERDQKTFCFEGKLLFTPLFGGDPIELELLEPVCTEDNDHSGLREKESVRLTFTSRSMYGIMLLPFLVRFPGQR